MKMANLVFHSWVKFSKSNSKIKTACQIKI